MPTPQAETPGTFVATETLSKYPTGPEAYSVLEELWELGSHTPASAWDHGLADLLRRRLTVMRVDWTSIHALRIVHVAEPESSSPAIVWIGVEPGALSLVRGSDVALECRTLINSRGVHDCHVEIQGSRVMREAGDGLSAELASTYALDLAIIKADASALDANNYRGNSINMGRKYTRQEFMHKACPNPNADSPPPFRFPANRLVALQGQVAARDLVDLPMFGAEGGLCFTVFKHGAKTGTTVGRANRVTSYTRNCLAGEHHESQEWPVIPIPDKHKNKNAAALPFSDRGDSGACVADVFGRVGGIRTGGSGATDDSGCDVSYVTPISFIMEIIRRTERFKNARLDPVLHRDPRYVCDQHSEISL